MNDVKFYPAVRNNKLAIGTNGHLYGEHAVAKSIAYHFTMNDVLPNVPNTLIYGWTDDNNVEIKINVDEFKDYVEFDWKNVNYFLSNYNYINQSTRWTFWHVVSSKVSIKNGKIQSVRYTLSLDTWMSYYDDIMSVKGIAEVKRMHNNVFKEREANSGKYIVDVMGHPYLRNCDEFCTRLNDKNEFSTPELVYSNKHYNYDKTTKQVDGFFEVDNKGNVVKQVRAWITVFCDKDESGSHTISKIDEIVIPFKMFLFAIWEDDINQTNWSNGITWIQKNGWRIASSNVITDIFEYKNLVAISENEGWYQSSDDVFHNNIGNGIVFNRDFFPQLEYHTEELKRDIVEPHLEVNNHKHFELANVNKKTVLFDWLMMIYNFANIQKPTENTDTTPDVPWKKKSELPFLKKANRISIIEKYSNNVKWNQGETAWEETASANFLIVKLNAHDYIMTTNKSITLEELMLSPTSNDPQLILNNVSVSGNVYKGAVRHYENGWFSINFGYDEEILNSEMVFFNDNIYIANSPYNDKKTIFQGYPGDYKPKVLNKIKGNFKATMEFQYEISLSQIGSDSTFGCLLDPERGVGQLGVSQTDFAQQVEVRDSVIAINFTGKNDAGKYFADYWYILEGDDVYKMPFGKYPNEGTVKSYSSDYFWADDNSVVLTKEISYFSSERVGYNQYVMTTETSTFRKVEQNQFNLQTSGTYQYPYYSDTYTNEMKTLQNQRQAGIDNANATYNTASTNAENTFGGNMFSNVLSGIGGIITAGLSGGTGGIGSVLGSVSGMVSAGIQEGNDLRSAKTNRDNALRSINAKYNDLKNSQDNINVVGIAETTSDLILRKNLQLLGKFNGYWNFWTALVHKMEISSQDKETIKMHLNKFGYVQDRFYKINGIIDLCERVYWNYLEVANMYELLLMNGLPEFVVGRIAKEFQNGVFLFNTDTQGYEDILDFTRNNYPAFLDDKAGQQTALDFALDMEIESNG